MNRRDTMSGHVPPLHIFALIGIPLIAAGVFAWAGVRFVGRLLGFLIAIYASVTNRDAIVLLVLVGVATVGFTVLATCVMEQVCLGPMSRRPVETRRLTRWTRLGVVAGILLAPMAATLWRDASARHALAVANDQNRAAAQRSVERKALAATREQLLAAGSPAEVLEAADALRRGYDEVERVVLDASLDDALRVRGIEVLGSLGDRRALPLLRAIVTSEPSKRLETATLDERYRDTAMRATYALHSQTEGIVDAYQHERQAATAVQRISAAQRVTSTQLGWFDSRVDCLQRPEDCNPGASLWAKVVLGRAGARIELPIPGYRTLMVAGAASAAAVRHVEDFSRTRVVSYAFLAVPDEPYRTGMRAFCADDTGVICATLDGRRPLVSGTRCVVTTRTLPDDSAPVSADTRRRRECQAAD